MVFNPVYENINALSAKKGEAIQSVVESAFTLRDLGEVLKIDCRCRINRAEIADGYIKAEAIAEYKVLYLREEGVACESFDSNFSVKTPIDIKNGKVRAVCTPIDTGVSAISGKEIKVASVVETVFIVTDCENVHSLSTTSSGFYLKESAENYMECKCSEKAKTEYSLSDKTIMEEVVFSRATCVINKRSSGVDSVSLDGEIILETVGLRSGEICSQTLAIPYSETFECNGVGYGDTVIAEVVVTFCDAVVIEQSDGNKLDGVVKCDFDFAVYSEREFLNVRDVFSVKKQMLTTLKTHHVCEKISNFTILERVEGNVKLGDNMPACDVILSACAFDAVVNSVKSEEGSVIVEGTISGRVIYSCSAPNKTASAYVVSPFSFSALVPFGGDEEIIAKADVTAITCRVRRGNEIDIKADLSVLLTAFKNKDIAVISELKEGEDIAVPTSAFSLYLGEGGESLWDVAGILGVNPDALVEQNSHVSFPLSKGDRITVYRLLDSKKI